MSSAGKEAVVPYNEWRKNDWQFVGTLHGHSALHTIPDQPRECLPGLEHSGQPSFFVGGFPSWFPTLNNTDPADTPPTIEMKFVVSTRVSGSFSRDYCKPAVGLEATQTSELQCDVEVD